MNNTFQDFLRSVEVGRAEILTRLVPFIVTVFLIGLIYNFTIYHGLNDAQSMDNAQLARQISRGDGYTTEFLRPYAVKQMRDYATRKNLLTGGSSDLFPSDKFSAQTPRVLPDTYNAPGYPYLLAAWFKLVRPHFDQPVKDMTDAHAYAGDRWIPPLNIIFMVLTGALIFILGIRLFDERVAWMALTSFAATNLIWQFALTALSTSLLMFLVTGVIFCALEIFSIGEFCFRSEGASFGKAWIWGLVLSLLLIAACLTRLHLLVLLVPLLALLFFMPCANYFLPPLIALAALACTGVWFWHIYLVSGNPLGSNLPLLRFGGPGFEGNQIFCTTSLPLYEGLLRDIVQKECVGFRWHFEHFWSLFGCSPMALLFVAAFLHQFKRLKSQVFQWLLLGCTLILIAANNLGSDNPEPLSAWNTVIVLLPCMLLVGSAFFFILLDRLNIQIGLLKNLIVIIAIGVSAFPMILTLTTSPNQLYNYPPYMPPVIKIIGQFAQPNEWVTTDMPWATAWYADRASLWMPDSIAEFENMNDTLCPTGVMLITPVTWTQPMATLTSNGGEMKEWLPFVTLVNLPPNFPLRVHTSTPPGGPEYSIWCDRPRWQAAQQ